MAIWRNTMKTNLLVIGYFILAMSGLIQSQESQSSSSTNNSKGENQLNTSQVSSVDVPKSLRFTLKSIDGKDVNLADYQGKVIVIVNTASKCGMTPQYKDLQELHEKHAEEGLVILGFPCNQFGGQEPGSESQIVEFCSANYGVTFDMFSKVEVKGDGAHELFKYLTSQDVKPGGKGEVRWNFEKFVINRSGDVIARFGSRIKPSSPEFMSVIKEALN